MKKEVLPLRLVGVPTRPPPPKKSIHPAAPQPVQVLFSRSSHPHPPPGCGLGTNEGPLAPVVPYCIADDCDEVCRFFLSRRFAKKKRATVFYYPGWAAWDRTSCSFFATEKNTIFFAEVLRSFLCPLQENIFLSFVHVVCHRYPYENMLENTENSIHHAFDFFIQNHNVLHVKNVAVPPADRDWVRSFGSKKIVPLHCRSVCIQQKIFVQDHQIVSILFKKVAGIETIPHSWCPFCERCLPGFAVFHIPNRLLQEPYVPNQKRCQIFQNQGLCAPPEKAIQKNRSVFETMMTDETVSLPEWCTIFHNVAQRLLHHGYAECGLPGEKKIDFLKKIYPTVGTGYATDPFFARALHSVLYPQKKMAPPTNRDTLLHQASVLAARFSFLPPPFVVYHWLLLHCTRIYHSYSVIIPMDTLIYFSMYYLYAEKYDVSLMDDRCLFSFAKTYLSLEKIHDLQKMVHAVCVQYHHDSTIDIFPHGTTFMRRIANHNPVCCTQATRKSAVLELGMTHHILERVCKESAVLVDIKGLFLRDEPFLSMHLTQLDCAMRAYLEKSFALLEQNHLVFSQDALFKYVWSYLMEDIHTYDKEEIIKSIYRGIVMKCAEEYGTLLQEFSQKNFVFDASRYYVYDGVIRSFYANVHHCTAALGLAALSEKDIDRLSCDHL